MRLSRSLVSALILMPVVVSAASFPDIPASYPHRTAIEKLTDRGVISGNPDGTFRPYDPVDRASMLKMLYKAGNLTVNGTAKNCFSDVLPGSWYEGFVCDAVTRGFVQGYDNGKSFKPGRPVSRAEALKLSLAVLGVAPMEYAGAAVYTDVPSSHWVSTYLLTALARKILPIPGQTGPSFQPNTPLERGEAAAYIWNALEAKNASVADELPSVPASSASSSSSSSAAGTSMDEKRAQQRAAENAALQEDLKNTKRVTFPFTSTATFSGKHSLSFKFSINSPAVADITSAVVDGKGGVSCRLYRLEDDGFSTEYYLGLQEGTSCYLRSKIVAGDYQLELQPTTADSSVRVEAKVGTGDGNDGLSEARLLQFGKVKTDILDPNDLEDWYTFKVTQDTSPTTEPGQKLRVDVVSADTVKCTVYAGKDVNLFGFAGPQCNTDYIFPVGTYYLSIGHTSPRASKQTYTLTVK